MAYVNYSTREINVKIVYYGPGLCGKTANLQYLYSRAPAQNRGRLISLATETERTLFFDFLPMNLGVLHGFKVRFHLYTVPGQVFYEASRKLILKGVDGLMFVADSDPLRVDANVESWEGLLRNLAGYGLSVPPLPVVVQYNKRDLPGALPVAEIRESLGSPDLPQFEGVAIDGTGVFESLKSLAKGVLTQLQHETLPADRTGFSPEPAAPEPPSAAPEPAPRAPISTPAPMADQPFVHAKPAAPPPPSPPAAHAPAPASAVGMVRPPVANPVPGDPRPGLGVSPRGEGVAPVDRPWSGPTAPVPEPPARPAAPPPPPAAPPPVKRRGFGWFRRSR